MAPGTVGAGAGGLEVVDLSAWFGPVRALKGVNLSVPGHSVTAIIGPSGCGKSTLVRCLNRMHEEVRGARVAGKVLFDGRDIYGPEADPVEIRRRIGMVFQRPNPFPTLSVLDNAVAGLKLAGRLGRSELHERGEWALRAAGLWDEVRDRLDQPGGRLSGGQQQRLCIARALAVEPEVLLMDEPASALDPASTLRIEELIEELKEDYTVVIVTHNMQQAARVSDWTLFMLLGEAVEFAPTSEIFTNPADRRTEDYVTGRFG
ncbi:MAG: phosphate ABC transporter ATP-binding protein PstB [Candidatus Velamenicoccus archaeovorus]